MTVQKRPYARIYYVDLARDYPDVWKDVAVLGTYVRLLSLAEAIWPANAEIPRSASSRAVRTLMAAGLLIGCEEHCYRIKGMDAERNARSNAASNAARIRFGIADGNAPRMPNQTEPNQTKPSQARAMRNGKVEAVGDLIPGTLKAKVGWG